MVPSVPSVPAGALAATVASSAPTGPAYSIVLIAHVLCAVVGFGAVALTGVQAWRARRGPDAPGAAAVRRFFTPGVNWAARLLYGVPVFGFALLAMSKGAFDTDDAWVTAGLLVWLVAAGTAELVVWPGERRIQRALAAPDPDAAPGAEPATGHGTAPPLERTCLAVAVASAGLAACFVGATVLMVAKP